LGQCDDRKAINESVKKLKMDNLYLREDEDERIIWYQTKKGAPSGEWNGETSPEITVTDP
jgi:hypothetical protein